MNDKKKKQNKILVNYLHSLERYTLKAVEAK